MQNISCFAYSINLFDTNICKVKSGNNLDFRKKCIKGSDDFVFISDTVWLDS